MMRHPLNVSRLAQLLVLLLLFYEIVVPEPATEGLPTEFSGEVDGNVGQERQLNKKRRKWRTLQFSVDGAYRSYRKTSSSVTQNISPTIAPSSYVTGDMLVGVFNAGSNLGNNNIYNKNDPNNPIGINFQTCVTPMTQPVDTFLCQWVLAFTDVQQNQIMAQGAWFNNSIDPLNVNSVPSFQFIAITGGTGIFRAITGFIAIAPRNLLDVPPKWWYYIVYRNSDNSYSS